MMTRPNIVRADTLDLQDQDNPTAAEHQRHPGQDGIAPHQRAEVHHVIEERESEEQSLADAWNITGNLTEEPGAIDQAQQQQNGTTTNGVHQEGEEGGEGGESEAEGDEDMMDRISSSPSIDDGGYTLHSSPPPMTTSAQRRAVIWPERTSSLSPTPRNTPTPTPTRETSNKSPLSSTPDSSPFLQTPQHLPLHVRRTGMVASPLVSQEDGSSSPFDEVPSQLPLIKVRPADSTFSHSSKCHHSLGRYKPGLERELDLVEEEEEDGRQIDDEGFYEQDMDMTRGNAEDPSGARHERFKNDCGPFHDHGSESSVLVHSLDQDMRPIESPFRNHSFPRSSTESTDQHMEQSPSLISLGSVNLQDVLLPVDDPLLDTPPSPTGSSASWESLPSQEGEQDSSSQNPDNTNDDDTDALFADLDDRFIDSGWGGECLRETEDIDFEFVYALHTFVATVEGQANATKGDTMVLLDDSNSYWWLVRVVKDGSIGYLPAEHIETPTERLARLNKHRNIDLSATMLSDNSEKSRNPLKKAIRRRNAKTVQFAAPTYVEASDYDYSSDEDERPSIEPHTGVVEPEQIQTNAQVVEEERPAEANASQEDGPKLAASHRASFDREQAATAAAAMAAQADPEEPQLSPKLVDKTEAAPLKSRKGTPRNADSFLKDDSIETRKITLTPGLLREDSGSIKSASEESTRNNSMENISKQVSPPEQLTKRDSKKEKKEKKPGMLSGLFKSKRKDKKAREDLGGEQSDAEKPSMEFSRDSPRASPLPSGRNSPSVASSGTMSPVDMRRPEVQSRQPSRGKLQKAPPSSTSSPVREPQPQPQQNQSQVQEQQNANVAELAGSEAAHEMAASEPEPAAPAVRPDMTGREQSFRPHLPGEWVSYAGTPTSETPPLDTRNIDTQAAQSNQDSAAKGSPLSPLTNILKRDDSKAQKPAKAKRSKKRVELDDFDSPADEEGPNPFKEQEDRRQVERGSEDGDEDDAERLSDSPVEITHTSFMHGTESIHIPTPGLDDLGEDEDDDDEEPESLTSSPSIIEHPAEPIEGGSEAQQQEDNDSTPTGPRSPQPNIPAQPQIHTQAQTEKPALPSPGPNRGLSTDSTTTTASSASHLSPATPSSQQSWSDSSLRAWLEDGSEVKDMMVMIHDKSGVVPVGADHPLMAGLFVEQKRGVQDMMGRLDGLLGGYLERKGIALG